MDSVGAKVLARIAGNRLAASQSRFSGLGKSANAAAAAKVLGKGALRLGKGVLAPGLFVLNEADNEKDYSRAGLGDPEDLYGLIDESGYVRSAPAHGATLVKNMLYYTPYVGLLGTPSGLYENIFLHDRHRREPTDRFYKMREGLARAGIEIGSNGSKIGLVNNRGVKHKNPSWTLRQRRSLRGKMIDPSTGAPLSGWKRFLDAADIGSKFKNLEQENFVLSQMNKAKLAPSDVFSKTTGLSSLDKAVSNSDKSLYGAPKFRLRESLG